LKISVLLWNLPSMLADIIETLLRSEQEVTVHAGSGSPDAWRETVADCGSDVVVTWFENGVAPAGGEELLWSLPKLRLLALRGDASRAFLMRLIPQIEALGELSPEDLIAKVRQVAREPRRFEPAGEQEGRARP
jgi:hypothetical protein